MFLPRLAFIFTALLHAGMAYAHEFWIDTENFQVAPGAELQASLRNGELFAGSDIAYFDKNTTRFDTFFDGTLTPLEPRLGDSPALQITAPGSSGLMRVVHEAAPSTLTYTKWEKFLTFAEHKDFPTVAEDHAAAGFPKDRFIERYSRHSKALIAIGDGEAGNDAEMGLETELTALKNPYSNSYDGQMRVALSYQGRPRTDAQIEVYARDDDRKVTVTIYRTDNNGHASFPTQPGHDYLVDAVVLRKAPDALKTPESPVWETLWASLTFHVP